MSDTVLEYLKTTCCPKCMGREVVDKTFTYKGCPNDDYSMVIQKGDKRFWVRFPKPTDDNLFHV